MPAPTSPLALTDEQMTAILAASHPLPPDVRGPFLEACARELAALPVVGDGVVHRVVMFCQQRYFDPPLETERHEPRHDRRRVGEPIADDSDRRTRSSRARV
jgi:hypothetical protein